MGARIKKSNISFSWQFISLKQIHGFWNSKLKVSSFLMNFYMLLDITHETLIAAKPELVLLNCILICQIKLSLKISTFDDVWNWKGNLTLTKKIFDILNSKLTSIFRKLYIFLIFNWNANQRENQLYFMLIVLIPK